MIVRKVLAFGTILFCFAALPLTVSANSRVDYTPPPRKGTIYIVVNFKPYSSRDQMRMDEKTSISVKWGGYSKTGAYGRGRLSLTFKDGFVITLRHTKDDSVPMVVESEGQILRVAQLDSPPAEFKNSRYDKYNW